jgi:hypothetical protein
MLQLQARMRPLERLELFEFSHGAGRWSGPGASSQGADADILPPLRQHEGMDLECCRHGLHLNPGLLTQANGGQLELVRVAANGAWS